MGADGGREGGETERQRLTQKQSMPIVICRRVKSELPIYFNTAHTYVYHVYIWHKSIKCVTF